VKLSTSNRFGRWRPRERHDLIVDEGAALGAQRGQRRQLVARALRVLAGDLLPELRLRDCAADQDAEENKIFRIQVESATS